MADSKKVHFSKLPILLTQGPIHEIFTKKFWELAILKNALFLSRPFWIFFCFFPMKISQSLLVSKDGSKFWSSQMWQHFLTHTKHSWGECTNIPKKLEGTFLNGKLCRFLQFLYLYFVLKRWQNFISKYLFLRLDSECIYFMNSLATRNQQFGCQIDAKQW